MNVIKKFISIPSGKTNVEAVELYEVRWTSRYGSYNADTKPEIEVLTSEQDAIAFADALKRAFSLLRHTGNGTLVEVKKRN